MLEAAGFHLRGVAKGSCVLAVLVFATNAVAGNAEATPLAQAPPAESPAQAAPAPPSSPKAPALLPQVSYVDGQLKIDAHDSTLADVLTKVAALTGVAIDVPAAANSERMPIIQLGPGPARQILASLLNDSNFDYLIQASDTDPEKIQNVLVLPREKKGSGGTDAAAARPSRAPYARFLASPAKAEEAPTPDSPVLAQTDNPATEENSSAPPPAATQPDVSPRVPALQPEQSNLPRPGALSPPQTLSPQTINQQLLQMYQQRMQMIQQDHPATPPPAAPANPASKYAPSASGNVRQ